MIQEFINNFIIITLGLLIVAMTFVFIGAFVAWDLPMFLLNNYMFWLRYIIASSFIMACMLTLLED